MAKYKNVLSLARKGRAYFSILQFHIYLCVSFSLFISVLRQKKPSKLQLVFLFFPCIFRFVHMHPNHFVRANNTVRDRMMHVLSKEYRIMNNNNSQANAFWNKGNENIYVLFLFALHLRGQHTTIIRLLSNLFDACICAALHSSAPASSVSLVQHIHMANIVKYNADAQWSQRCGNTTDRAPMRKRYHINSIQLLLLFVAYYSVFILPLLAAEAIIIRDRFAEAKCLIRFQKPDHNRPNQIYSFFQCQYMALLISL